MKGLDLLKGNIIWVVLGSVFFYIIFILFSDINEISEQFLHIKIELVFLVFLFGMVSHIIKSIRQKEFLQMLDEKNTL